MTEEGPPPSPAASRLDRLPVALRWVIYLLGLASAVVGTVVAVVGLFGAHLDGAWVVAVFLMLCIVFALVMWLATEHFDRLYGQVRDETIALRGRTESLEGQIQESIHRSRSVDFVLNTARRLNAEVAALHDRVLSREHVLSFVQKACDGLEGAYAQGAAIKNRVCLKEVEVGEDGKLYALDVYRTNEPVDMSKRIPHLLEGNTDFWQLFRQEKSVWFTGNRSRYVDYRTTSHNPKYESVIVWPIFTRSLPGDSPIKNSLQAFLCLDSEAMDAFSEERDVPVGWMVADALSRIYENAEM